MASHLTDKSRPPDPPRRRKGPAALELTRSNSTASMFLGGARKSWMSAIPPPKDIHDQPSTATPAPAASQSAPSPPPPSPPPQTSRPVSPSVARQTESPTTPVAAVSSPSPTRPAGMRQLSSNAQPNVASFRGNQGAITSSIPPAAVPRNVLPRAQISPTSHTPPSLTRSPALRTQSLPRNDDARIQLQKQQKQQQQQHQQQLQAQLEQQSASSLPSPDPTIPPRSHASPVAAIERNGPPIISPSTTAFPSPPLQQAPSNQPRPRSNGPTVGTFRVHLPNNQQSASPPAHQINARTGSYTPPVRSYPISNAPNHSNPASLPPRPPGPPAASTVPNHPLVTDTFFERAKILLDAFAANESQLIAVPTSVETARFSLLTKACTEKDFVYIALHQLYCLSSFDLAGIRGINGFTQEHEHGLFIVQELLVPNDRVSDRLLKWCVDFPYPLSDLLTDREYQGHFHQMMRLLPNIARNWASLGDHVSTCGHPPLVEDMVRFLGLTSPVLRYSVYLCLSRRIPGIRAEGHLLDTHKLDTFFFQRGLSDRISSIQRQRENIHIIQLYHKEIAAERRGHGIGPPADSAPAQALPVSNQALLASESAPTALQATRNFPHRGPSHSQMHVGTQNPTNGVSSPSVRSPLTVAPPRLPGQPTPNQHFTQQRASDLQGPNLQMTEAVRSPVVATASQPMSPRGLPQGYPGQQHRQFQQPHSQPHHQFQQVQQVQQAQQPRHVQQPQQPHHIQQLQQFQQSPHAQYVQRLQQRPQTQGAIQAQRPQHPGRPNATDIQHSPQAHRLTGPRGSHPNVHHPIPPQHQQQLPRRAAIPLLPPPNVPPVMNTRPNPNRLAIHQAHLRDTVNRFVSINDTGENPTELLPHLTSFLLKPTILREPDRAIKWSGSLTDREIERRPSCQSQGSGQRMLRTFKDGTQTYRLRCIKVSRPTTELSEHSWSVAETAWPTAIYMHVNDNEVFARRKLHNTRDLPLDITVHLQEGENKINFHFVLGPAELQKFTYAVAVEVLTFRSLAPAKALVQTLPAAESQKHICGKLARNPDDEDDELKIVSDDLKVILVDPFTQCIFNVPVRGLQCEHTECFDHETFLQTRLLRTGDQSPIEADWRCPICRRDARPQNLVVDEFLAGVRKELDRTNRCSGARSLQIKADGTWDVKTDEALPSSEQGPTGTKRKSTAPENEITKRPKVDRSTSLPQGVDKPNHDPTPSESPAVIILD